MTWRRAATFGSMDPRPLTIGKLAKRLELNPRTIRFYEQSGVLPEPERADSGSQGWSR